MIPDNYISLKEASTQLKMDKGNLYHLIKKLKIKMDKTRESNGHTINIIELSDFEKIKNYRQNPLSNNKKITNIDYENGVFYVIQPIPEYNLNRIKVGFSNNIDTRKLQYSTICPSTNIIKTWQCKRCWEKTIIAQSTSSEQKLGEEIFEVKDLEQFIKKLDFIFSLFHQTII